MEAADGTRTDLTAEEFALFRDWIHRHSGIFLEESKAEPLRVSLVTRASHFGIEDYADYFRLLSADEDEFKELMNLVTINETSFFRFPAQFEALRDVVVPEIVEARSLGASTPFRVWSAGCSTGEEPYSIAMTLLDSRLGSLGSPCKVVGTDVSTQALERAMSGVYPERALTSVPPQAQERWFESVDGGWRPRARIRELCDFRFHNLIDEAPPSDLSAGWDVIFCRNVTIYFRLESTRRVIERFYDALNPGGYLFIGHSETLTPVTDRFETVQGDGVFYYRKPPARHLFTFGEVSDARRRRVSEQRDDRKSQRPRSTGAVLAPEDVFRENTRREAPSSAVLGAASAQRADVAAQAHALLDDARPVEALELAQCALVDNPSDVEARLVVAYAHADLGNLETAAAHAAAIVADHPLVAPARYILGAIRKEQGDASAAMSEFKRALYIDPEFVLAHFALAGMHRRRGDEAEAFREYGNALRALERSPHGSWTAFLGGFTPEVLKQTCQRGMSECRAVAR